MYVSFLDAASSREAKLCMQNENQALAIVAFMCEGKTKTLSTVREEM